MKYWFFFFLELANINGFRESLVVFWLELFRCVDSSALSPAVTLSPQHWSDAVLHSLLAHCLSSLRHRPYLLFDTRPRTTQL
jgi:hypothetical protein